MKFHPWLNLLIPLPGDFKVVAEDAGRLVIEGHPSDSEKIKKQHVVITFTASAGTVHYRATLKARRRVLKKKWDYTIRGYTGEYWGGGGDGGVRSTAQMLQSLLDTSAWGYAA